MQWKKGDPLPPGTFFADYEKDGWPIGIGRLPAKKRRPFDGDDTSMTGTLSIRKMKLRRSKYGDVIEHDDDFEILCRGNLVWMPYVARENEDYEVEEPKKHQLMIGKVFEDGEVYVGDIELDGDHLSIAYDVGTAEIYIDFFELLDQDKFEILEEKSVEPFCQRSFKLNMGQAIQEQKATFLEKSEFYDLKFILADSSKTFKVHKIVLAQVSQLFYEMNLSLDEITIDEFDSSSFEAFIK